MGFKVNSVPTLPLSGPRCLLWPISTLPCQGQRPASLDPWVLCLWAPQDTTLRAQSLVWKTGSCGSEACVRGRPAQGWGQGWGGCGGGRRGLALESSVLTLAGAGDNALRPGSGPCFCAPVLKAAAPGSFGGEGGGRTAGLLHTWAGGGLRLPDLQNRNGPISHNPGHPFPATLTSGLIIRVKQRLLTLMA